MVNLTPPTLFLRITDATLGSRRPIAIGLFFRHLLKGRNVNGSGGRLINHATVILFQDKMKKMGINFQICFSQQRFPLNE